MNASRKRKILYLLSIIACFVALIFVNQKIDAAADANRLALRSLGNVNPVRGTANLVFVGFRGVAVSFLWHEAIELKKKQRWFEIRPVINSITELQPNFTKPWTFQAWNMAWNIASEWESVDDKYTWIKEGVKFMTKAVDANQKNSDLDWYGGWIYFQRFGFADEHFFLRDVYRDDPDTGFTMGTSGRVDSFEKAFDWFTNANSVITETRKKPISSGITPFMSYPARSKANYADFLSQDGQNPGSTEKGIFGEKPKNAWREAHQHWLEFGRMGIPGREGDPMHKLEFTKDEFAKLTPEEIFWANHFGKIVNYKYWRQRALSEATDDMQQAREHMFRAKNARLNADYATAIEHYEKSFPLWKKIFDSDPDIKDDSILQEDAQRAEYYYLKTLTLAGMPQPAKRPFDNYLAPMVDQPAYQGPRDLDRAKPTGANSQQPTNPTPQIPK